MAYRNLKVTDWRYRGAIVRRPHTADIPMSLIRGRDGRLVQWALDQTPPWEVNVSPIETVDMGVARTPTAYRVGDSPLTWGIHVGHKAKRPGLSPFIINDSCRTRDLTIELVGTPEEPVLVRAYYGDYTPPLPWMASAAEADGGRATCYRFWSEHAYVQNRLRSLIVPTTETTNAPQWYRFSAIA